jgi:uncharacterized protein (TIGR00369 family)
MARKDGFSVGDPAAVARRFSEQVPHSRDLGMRIDAMDNNQVHMRLDPKPWLLDADDAASLCSSVLYSLADSAAGISVYVATRTLTPIATLDLRMDYWRPAAGDCAVLAIARCLHFTEEIAFVQCEIRSEGYIQPVATGTATFMRNTRGQRFQAPDEKDQCA